MEQTKISSSQGTQPAHAARPRPGAQGTDSADAAGAGGFLALLAALGDASGPSDGAPMDLAATDKDAVATLLPDAGKDPNAGFTAVLTDADKAAADAAALAAWQGLLVPSAPSRAVSDTASLSPQDALLGGRGNANALTAAFAGLDGAAQGLVAETATLDASSDLKGGPQPALAQGFGRAFSRMQGNALAQKADSLESIGGRAVVGDSGKLSLMQHGFTPTVGAAFQSVGERVAGGTLGERATAGAPGAPGGLAAVEAGASAADGLLAATASARGGEASGGRAGDGPQGAAAWSDGLSAGAPQEPGNVDGSVFADPTQAQAGAEEQVADQVAYWVHQKTQNAEITLHRDGQPVEVSVSLSGNEAHVSFRSDQAQTRDMLDRSMEQLGDLLRSEGLVLSGMSVGTSAGQGAGSGEQPRQREDSRKAQVVSSVPTGTASLQRSGGAPDRAVDIFV